jgi:protein-tyrosine phosphatase
MNNQNIVNLLEAFFEEIKHKVSLLLSFEVSEKQEVPDPYYSGKRGFEYVLDLIEQGADGFIAHIKSNG